MTKKTIMKIFTPMLTLMTAVVLVSTTLAWYSFVLDTSEATAECSVTAKVNEGGEGYDADITLLGDYYERKKIQADNDQGFTYLYTVNSTAIEDFDGYCGQTGRPEDSIHDTAYIVFLKATITTPETDKFSTINSAYVNSAQIYWNHVETKIKDNVKYEYDGYDEKLINSLQYYADDVSYYDGSEKIDGTTLDDYDKSTKLLIDFPCTKDDAGNATAPNEVTEEEWRVVMLSKQDFVNNTYTFLPSDEMVLDTTDAAAASGAIVFYCGIMFHNGDTSHAFKFSDTVFTGCHFSLDLKFITA